MSKGLFIDGPRVSVNKRLNELEVVKTKFLSDGTLLQKLNKVKFFG